MIRIYGEISLIQVVGSAFISGVFGLLFLFAIYSIICTCPKRFLTSMVCLITLCILRCVENAFRTKGYIVDPVNSTTTMPPWLITVLAIMGSVDFSMAIVFVDLVVRDYYQQLKGTDTPLTKLRVVALVFLCITEVAFILLTLVLVKDVKYERTLYMMVLITSAVWANIAASIILIWCSAVHIRSSVLHSQDHISNGPLGMMLVFGMTLRIAIDAYQIFTGTDIMDYLSDANSDPFFDLSKDMLTEAIPILFHLWNLKKDPNIKLLKTNDGIRDGDQLPEVVIQGVQDDMHRDRVKMSLHFIIVTLHITATCYVVGNTSAEAPVSLIIARASAFWAFIDYSFLLIAICSPLVQLFYRHFHSGISSHSIHKVHFHLTMALTLTVEALIHASAHVYTWHQYPDLMINGRRVYSWTGTSSVPIYTGIVMILTIIMALISGWCFRSSKSIRFGIILANTHIILVTLNVSVFFFHGYAQILGPPIGDRVVLLVSIVFGTLYLVYFLVYLPTTSKVEQFGSDPPSALADFVWFKIKATRDIVDTYGAYCTIYLKNTFFAHGHQFSCYHWPWINAQQDLVAGMIPTSPPTAVADSLDNDHVHFVIWINKEGHFTTSLCRNLLDDQPLTIHGPYVSSGNSMIQRILEARHPVDLCLYATNTGITVLMSVLSHLLSTPTSLAKVRTLRLFWTTRSSVLQKHIASQLNECWRRRDTALKDRTRLNVFFCRVNSSGNANVRPPFENEPITYLQYNDEAIRSAVFPNGWAQSNYQPYFLYCGDDLQRALDNCYYHNGIIPMHVFSETSK
ncbi:hypothetical protein SAMD00019534_027080 [Acytostelium subglobosum LB1]|uniref:hypothetical protein n=1 Tax=Acytostelium subglobosum LB1 TaxID=1410327 RepID=UPI000644CBAD|nr:hypothetical protein SAMD00019534_027080 [Acytostelium subglobosum LB1]GAM19533.1 hypothetical protein SAMD00019534_027080 [Acytostelium subglobosum LB1]|eukprot:XP_012757460.1 hypothetical protein SAMD00019534_027080 [Acytostelium subglobosum LB1]